MALGAFGGTEAFEIERGIGEDPDWEEGKYYGEDSFEEEYKLREVSAIQKSDLIVPYLPAMQPPQTLYLLDSSCQQTRKRTGNGSGAQKETNANLKLMRSIEAGKIEHEPGEKATFEKSDEKTTCEQAAIGFDL